MGWLLLRGDLTIRQQSKGERGMDEWWYVRNEEKIGPVSTSDLKSLLQRESIGTTTMVWQEGMDAWLPIGDVPALVSIKQAVPPPIPQQVESEQVLAMPLATRWPRFLARIFDLWWEGMLLSLLAGLVIGRYSAAFLEWIYKPGSTQLFGVLLIPFSLTLDAVVYALFRNTPGKALLGLRVTNLRGQRLSLTQYLRRNMGIWVAGLGFGVPFATLFTAARQSARLGRGQQASYDESSGARVHGKRLGTLRHSVFGLAFACLFVALAMLNGLDREQERESIAASQQKFYVWENPITKINTSVDARWKFSSQNNETGQRVYMFSEQADHAAVIFALEDAPGLGIGDYVRAFQMGTSSQMTFSDGGQFSEVGGRPSWSGVGTMKASANSRLRVRVVQFGSGFWRVVTIQAPPYEYSDAIVNALEKALWESVSPAKGKLAM
jgi:uncharacterized RDD family membrane protein YckC